MKTLQESIIGRKGSPIKFTKDMLKTGYVVKFRNNPYSEYGMYFSLEDIEKYQDTKTLAISHIIARLRKDNDMGVFISKEKYDAYPSWNPLSYYSEDLLSKNGASDSDFDIIEVYPVKTKPDFLTNAQLKDRVKDVNPIKINQ